MGPGSITKFELLKNSDKVNCSKKFLSNAVKKSVVHIICNVDAVFV